MEYKFSERVLTLKPSAIREIFKYAADPTYISLSAGNPAPEAFPVKPLAEISAKLMAENPILALQYSTTEGYTPLRDHLRAYMREKHNTGRDFDDILITSGAQQIMDLFTKSILNEGETVLTEAPSFIGTLNDFRSYRAKLVGIPMDTDGMNMEALEKALRTEKNVKFIYTIPNFQNPSGITMSLEKRKKLYDLAKQYGVMILEDNPYGDLRYAGEALPTIKSFDEEGIVLYAGSFSKVISPGMRVGYAIGDAEVIGAIQSLLVPFGVNSLALAAALASLADVEGVQCAVADIVAERERIVPALRDLGYDIPDTQSNFYLLRGSVYGLVDECARVGLIVRPFREGVRVSVGSREQNDLFYSVAAEFARTHEIGA